MIWLNSAYIKQYQIDLAAYNDLLTIYERDFTQYELDLEEYNNPSDPENPTITKEPIAPVAPVAPTESFALVVEKR
jgi:hypothetical protein